MAYSPPQRASKGNTNIVSCTEIVPLCVGKSISNIAEILPDGYTLQMPPNLHFRIQDIDGDWDET